jgi:lycopene beta-cyclase
VEYTFFSNEIVPDDVYETALKNYVEKIPGLQQYEVAEKEFGVIPMTNYSFTPVEKNIIHIGTAGGQTKGSSGFTFRFIQKHSAAIVNSLLKNKHPLEAVTFNGRFHFYDSILLHILKNRTLGGDQIFTDLFKNNRAAQVLKFLDNETTLPEDLSIIKTLPTLPFLKAAVQQMAARFS